MYIHNFYSDLLLSVRVLFDNFVFGDDRYIHRYEFNIGNRTFQLPKDYTPNFEFPSAIVTLNDESPAFGQRPDVTQMLPGYNIDQIPVLYNQTKENVLYVQEEMVLVPISAIINCESQLQAKEVANCFRRWLPINKFIQFLEFTSFLEISKPFLDANMFDCDVDDIMNLYMKLNNRTGEISHCFSLFYKPFIRLESISSASPDSTQRSYQVNIDLTYMIQFPIYLYNDRIPKSIERIDIAMTATTGFEPIADYPSSKMIDHTSTNANIKKGYIRRQFIIYSSEDVTTSFSVLDSVVVIPTTIFITSTGGKIVVNQTANENLIITINNENTYSVKESNITVDGVEINIDSDNYLRIYRNGDNFNISLNRKIVTFSVKFNSNDFVISNIYTYRFINNLIMLSNYLEYVIDDINNSIIFTFSQSTWDRIKPSITHPLILQFYRSDAIQPTQYGGIPNEINNVKVIDKTSIAVSITWTSYSKSTTRIEYGTTTEYGNYSHHTENYTNTHKATLYGLRSGTTYHYRVSSINENGENILSNDYTFITN